MYSMNFLSLAGVSAFDLKPQFDALSRQDLFRFKHYPEWMRGVGLAMPLRSCIDVKLFGKLFSLTHSIDPEFSFSKYIINLYQVYHTVSANFFGSLAVFFYYHY